MRTPLLSLQTEITQLFTVYKLSLLLFAILLCFGNYSNAAVTKPIAKPNKKRYSHIATGQKPADIVARPANILALPSISYSGPQSYNTAKAITALTPTTSGVATLAYSTGITAIGTGFTNPANVALDKNGNAFVADYGNGAIKEVLLAGGTGLVNSTFGHPIGVAVDAAGNIYVADNSSSSVFEILASNNSKIPLPTGTTVFNDPLGIAVDAAGNIYLTDHVASLVYKIPPGGGTPVSIGSGFNNPYGVAVDHAGNVYVADHNTGTIRKISIADGTTSVFASGFNNPTGVSVDGAGNVYVADFDNNAVKMIPAGGGAAIAIGTGFTTPFGVTADPGSGNIYVADYGNNTVKAIQPLGGYFISPALPAGLTLDNNTGIISGTPTAVSPATDYTITAYNSSGKGVAVVNITVNNPLPTISYASPQAYTWNIAITPLAPTSTLVAPAGYSANLVNFATGFSNPRGIGIDRLGNVYVADFGNNKVTEIPAGGGTPIPIGSGFTGPVGTAIDFGGNIYVADYNQNKVFKVPAGGGTPVLIGSGYAGAIAIAADATGNVYVADYNNGVIDKIAAVGGAQTIYAGGFTNPAGVAVDSLGNVYVADHGTSLITKIPPAGGTQVTLGSGFANPYGLTVDASGNVFVADWNHDSIVEIPAGGGTPVALNKTFNTVTGVVADAAGNLIITDYGNPAVLEIKPAGGYYLNTALPSGLNFSNTTGVISGTPLVVSPAANYIVTAYNGSYSPKTAIVNIRVTAIPLPAVTYGAAKTYQINTAMSLTPVSSGVDVVAYKAPVGAIASGFTTAYGIAVDPNGDLYVSDRGKSTITKYFPNGGGSSTVGSGFSLPSGLATDAAGDLFVADDAHQVIKEIPFQSNTPVTVGPTLSAPLGVAVDAAGNIYVADFNATVIKKIAAGATTTVDLGSGFTHPAGVAVDGSGNVFVVDEATGILSKIPAAGGTPVAVGTVYNQPNAVAIDPSGDVFVASSGNGDIKMIISSNGFPLDLPGAFSSPVGIATDGAGNVYVADEGNANVRELVPSGGYFISPVLPAGLIFNTESGQISGTPTVASPAKNYTITAYNNAGSSTSVVNITIAGLTPPNANLAGLAVSSGTLSPAFAAATFNYTTSVANATASITVTPVISDALATVKVNGATVTSGSASASLPLAVGPNTITAVVIASDGTTTKTYTIIVTRAAANNALLTHLAISSGTLKPVTGSPNYTVSVINAVTSVTVTPITSDPNATVKINGMAVTSGTASAAIPLSVGSNTINIVVTAQDGVTTQPYIITVTRAGAANALLSHLAISSGTLKPVTGSPNYTVSVVNTVTSVTVTPITSDPNSTVKINGTAVISGTASAAIPLSIGSNTINIVVTAQDGVTTQPYVITVTRAGAVNALLSHLAISSGTLKPVTGSPNYTVNVVNTVASVTVTPTTSDPNATVKINGTAVISGTASAAIPLSIGSNTINIVVTAQDGVTTQPYVITVTRAAAGNALLSHLAISSGTLKPVTGSPNYTASVANTVTSVTVTPTTSDPNATPKINGTAVISGMASAAIPLNVGSNTIKIVVTAQDGVTTQPYVITVTRAAAGNALLSHLAISSGTLTPVKSSPNYTVSVANTVTSVTVTPITADPIATVKINGTAVTSGTASAAIPLSVGSNTINIVVTAQDGVTTQPYVITVTRATGPLMSLYSSISVVQQANTAGIENDGVLVHQGVSPNGDGVNDVLTIDGIAAYPDNQLTIIDRNGSLIFQAKGYDNISKAFDGHSGINGRMQQPGTYFYALDYTVNGVNKHKTGFIILKY